MIAAMLAALVSCSSTTSRFAPSAEGPADARCSLYGVTQHGPSDSELFSIDLRAHALHTLGSTQLHLDLKGLAIHPTTLAIYAVSGKQTDLPGHLYRVDGKTGELTAIGATGFRDVTGLSFRPTDGTLWAWADGIGLVEIDPATGAGALRFQSGVHIEDLAWAVDGEVLYCSEHKYLWSYKPGAKRLTQINDKLPDKTLAVEMRPDGQLLGAEKDEQGVSFFVYSPVRRRESTSYRFDGRSDDITAIAWPMACGNPSPGGPADMITQVTSDKTSVCAGENLTIAVAAEHPEGAPNPVDVS